MRLFSASMFPNQSQSSDHGHSNETLTGLHAVNTQHYVRMTTTRNFPHHLHPLQSSSPSISITALLEFSLLPDLETNATPCRRYLYCNCVPLYLFCFHLGTDKTHRSDLAWAGQRSSSGSLVTRPCMLWVGR